MKSVFFTFFVLILGMSSCGEKSTAVADDGFSTAYPKMYTDLGLPQYRRGTLKHVTGKDEGVKDVHTFTIDSDDPPSYLRDFFAPHMQELGWRDLKARKRLSDIHEDDLYFGSYVKGKNKFEVSSSSVPTGGSKTRISLIVFTSN